MTANNQLVLGLAALAVLALISWAYSRRKPDAQPAPASGDDHPPSDETLEHLRTNARYLVWSGFHDPVEIKTMLPDILDEPVDEATIAGIVDAEGARKRQAERDWPQRTDCDRLDDAVAALDGRGILALQYAGYTQDDALGDLAEALANAEAEGRNDYIGYCFYTAQDVEHLLDGERDLHLGFGTNLEQASEAQQALGTPDNVGAVEAGRVIRTVFQEHGFETSWDETTATRIAVLGIDWKRRSR